MKMTGIWKSVTCFTKLQTLEERLLRDRFDPFILFFYRDGLRNAGTYCLTRARGEVLVSK
jgi:hypothetical protein